MNFFTYAVKSWLVITYLTGNYCGINNRELLDGWIKLSRSVFYLYMYCIHSHSLLSKIRQYMEHTQYEKTKKKIVQ